MRRKKEDATNPWARRTRTRLIGSDGFSFAGRLRPRLGRPPPRLRGRRRAPSAGGRLELILRRGGDDDATDEDVEVDVEDDAATEAVSSSRARGGSWTPTNRVPNPPPDFSPTNPADVERSRTSRRRRPRPFLHLGLRLPLPLLLEGAEERVAEHEDARSTGALFSAARAAPLGRRSALAGAPQRDAPLPQLSRAAARASSMAGLDARLRRPRSARASCRSSPERGVLRAAGRAMASGWRAVRAAALSAAGRLGARRGSVRAPRVSSISRRRPSVGSAPAGGVLVACRDATAADVPSGRRATARAAFPEGCEPRRQLRARVGAERRHSSTHRGPNVASISPSFAASAASSAFFGIRRRAIRRGSARPLVSSTSRGRPGRCSGTRESLRERAPEEQAREGGSRSLEVRAAREVQRHNLRRRAYADARDESSEGHGGLEFAPAEMSVPTASGTVVAASAARRLLIPGLNDGESAEAVGRRARRRRPLCGSYRPRTRGRRRWRRGAR